jgi:hypothetical protein
MVYLITTVPSLILLTCQSHSIVDYIDVREEFFSSLAMLIERQAAEAPRKRVISLLLELTAIESVSHVAGMCSVLIALKCNNDDLNNDVG